MASTEQRTGFRLPWATQARSDTLVDDQPPVDGEEQDDVASVTEGTVTREASEMSDNGISGAPATAAVGATAAIGAPAAIGATAAIGAAAAIGARAEAATPDEAVTPDDAATPDEAPAPAEAPAPTEAASNAPLATSATGPAADPTADSSPNLPPASSPRARRNNPLVAGLVRAMRDAAAAAREESAARFAEAAKARFEAIHARSAEEAADLRKRADAEIIEIREWSKAEMARLREETDQRISDRRRRLEVEVESHAALIEHRIERVQGAIDTFERRTDAFFERLFAEEDPARLAGLAEQLPEPPSLDIDDAESGLTTPTEVLDARGAAAAEAEALAGIEATDADDAEVGAPAAADAGDEPADVDLIRRLAALAGPAPDLPDAIVSRLAVTGLVSVASIAGFKRALARTHGVRSVSVASGPAGDFVFTVSHDPDTDIRSTVPTLDGFTASVTSDADDVIAISASDPESAQ